MKEVKTEVMLYWIELIYGHIELILILLKQALSSIVVNIIEHFVFCFVKNLTKG